MPRPSVTFAISTIVLLLFALFGRLIWPEGMGISLRWRAGGYLFSPGSLCIWLAAALCFFAAVYSLWMLPFSASAASWHCWLTIGGIAVFLLSFYRFTWLSRSAPAAPYLAGLNAAVAWGQIVSSAVVILAQAVFVVNFFQVVARGPQIPN